jgi:GrpB-like predicted nucleotidyltransferase (UPF0157 family)
MSAPITIVEYNPEWPSRYEAERDRILEKIGAEISAIEHIGSTAIPGVCAKPIIDMMAAVPGPGEADGLLTALSQIGYEDVTKIEGSGEWFYCLGRGSRDLYHHLHLVKAGSEHWRRHIAFRDYLRAHPEMALEYCGLKRALAGRYRTQREKYTESKTEFIERVVAEARGDSTS